MKIKTDPIWYSLLERIHPPSLDREFASIEFELAFAVNIRTALALVEATPACRRFADIAISNAVNYSCLRHGGQKGRILADALRAVDEALWRLITELRNCEMKLDAFVDRTALFSTEMIDRRDSRFDGHVVGHQILKDDLSPAW
ncbi:hypothetical protein LJR255_004009 [Pararhizobium sp. LjRoot255]|uniref:hypothetical protein n=1 Tax=Pararhizobium sp. LjRoot255 TaxID=3342298 RepID=UPI003ED10CAA